MCFLSLVVVAGGVYAWLDEHTGIGGTAHITRCSTVHGIGPRGRGSVVDCDATWVYKGKRVGGYVENGKYNQIGKDVSVRIHGTSHVTEQTYWVPLGLGLGGLACAGLFGFLALRMVGRPTVEVTPEPPTTGPAAA